MILASSAVRERQVELARHELEKSGVCGTAAGFCCFPSRVWSPKANNGRGSARVSWGRVEPCFANEGMALMLRGLPFHRVNRETTTQRWLGIANSRQTLGRSRNSWLTN